MGKGGQGRVGSQARREGKGEGRVGESRAEDRRGGRGREGPPHPLA
jgi:hypothetical protein